MLEVVIGIVALLLVICGFLFWRLVEGPLSLDFLTPVLVEAFDAQDQAGARAQITGTRLLWDEQRQSLELQVTGLTVDDAAGERSFALPLANIDFSFGRLLEGKVEVTDIEMIGASLTVRRNADQSFEVLLFQARGNSPPPASRASPTSDPTQTEPTQTEPAQSEPALTEPTLTEPTLTEPTLTKPGQAERAEGEVALSAIDALLSGGGLGPIQDLREITLRRSQIIVDDRVLGINWVLPAQNITLQRTKTGLSGEIDVGLPFGSESAEADLAVVYNNVSGTLDIAGQLAKLDLASLSKLLPQVQGLTVLESELNGDISATLGGDGRIFFVDFELTAGPGRLRPASDRLPPIEISGGAINGRINLADSSLSIYDLRVRTGPAEDPGPEIAATLQVRAEPDGFWDLKATAQAGAFPVTQLKWLWPNVYGPVAHDWVTDNITDGTVTSLVAAFDLRLSKDGAQYESLNGSFDFENLVLHYLRPMPPMRGLTGTTKVTGDRMVFDVKSGESEGLALGPGTVTISDLIQEVPEMLIDVPVAGSLADMMAVLDLQPLGLMKRAGIDRKGVKGQGRLQVTMGFPLLTDLKSEDMSLTAKGRFANVLVRRVVLGQDVASPSLALTSTMQRLTLKGEAEIAGSRLDVDYAQDFDGTLSLKGRSGDIEATTLAAMMPAVEGVISGALAGDFRIEGNPFRRMTIAADVDLTRTGIDPPSGKWTKSEGTAGRASGTVVMEDGTLSRIEGLSLVSEGLDVAGTITFAGDNRLRRAQLSHARYLEFDLGRVDVTQEPQLLRASVDGGTIDIRPWIRRGRTPIDQANKSLEKADAPPKAQVSLRNLQRIILPNGELRNVTADIDNSQAIFYIDLKGTLFVEGRSRGEVVIAFQPDNQGGRRGNLTIADGGAMLRALDVGDYIDGGTLTWRGATPAGQPDAPLAGRLSVGQFHMKEIPPALRVIMVAGLTGIEDALSGPGVSFDKLTGDLSIKGDRVTSKQLRAIGSALGVLASGSVDVSADRIDIEGKVVPAQAINSFLDKIPVLGWVITGGENQGLFAVSYDVEGSLKDPRITVNPLSALTPPVLRSLVEAITDGDGDSGDSSTPIKEPEGPQR